jgi:hypothetical protein
VINILRDLFAPVISSTLLANLIDKESDIYISDLVNSIYMLQSEIDNGEFVDDGPTLKSTHAFKELIFHCCTV